MAARSGGRFFQGGPGGSGLSVTPPPCVARQGTGPRPVFTRGPRPQGEMGQSLPHPRSPSPRDALGPGEPQAGGDLNRPHPEAHRQPPGGKSLLLSINKD